MSKTPDLRALKDKAAKAIEKRNYAKGAELYLEIAQHEDDPDWRQRAGEALRKANKNLEAAEQFTMAAEGYARDGFLLKAIAVCKVVLQLDPRHTAIQSRLAELYAQRDGSTRRVRARAVAPFRAADCPHCHQDCPQSAIKVRLPGTFRSG